MFNVTFVTSGPQTVTVTDETNPSLTATLNVNVVVPAVATHFAVILPPIAFRGVAVTAQLVALDAQNRPVPNYSGTLNVSSSDKAATYPSTVTFKNGVASLTVTFATLGKQSLTVADPANSSLTGVGYTMVMPPPTTGPMLASPKAK